MRWVNRKRAFSGRERNAVTAIIELLLHQPGLAMLIETPSELGQAPVAGADFLQQLVELVHSRPQINCAGIIENWRGTRYEARLREIAASSADLTAELTDPGHELLDAVERLKNEQGKQIRKIKSNISRMSDLSEADKQLLRKPSGRRKIPSEK